MAETPPPPPPKFWRKVPVDPSYDHWLTIRFERKVLVVVRTVTTLTRLLDILSLFEDDRRIQVVFTFDAARPALFSAGVPEFLASLEALVIPWEQAVETPFDLAIAASENDDLHELPAPVLLFPHGIGYQKYYPGGTVVAGMNPDRLVHAGRVVADRIGLSHGNQLRHLRTDCPEAVSHALVLGDPCHDRLVASAHLAGRYRRALHATGVKHVVLASTWGPESLIHTWPDLPERLLADLPFDDYRVTLILHPGVWSAHGKRQVHAWLTTARRAGLAVVPPQRGWQAALLAADCVISDCGSMPLYAAAANVPVMFATGLSATTVPGSPLAELIDRAPRLRRDTGLREQIDLAAEAPSLADVAQQAVEFPGKCAELLRPTIYGLLKLAEPAGRAVFPPVPDPEPIIEPVVAFVVGARLTGDVAELVRYPAALSPAEAPLPGQHVIAHAEESTLPELDGATIIYKGLEGDGSGFAAWAADTARLRPDAQLCAEVGAARCLVRTRDGDLVELTADDYVTDPLLLASYAYARLLRRLPLIGDFPLQVGGRHLTVSGTALP